VTGVLFAGAPFASTRFPSEGHFQVDRIFCAFGFAVNCHCARGEEYLGRTFFPLADLFPMSAPRTAVK